MSFFSSIASSIGSVASSVVHDVENVASDVGNAVENATHEVVEAAAPVVEAAGDLFVRASEGALIAGVGLALAPLAGPLAPLVAGAVGVAAATPLLDGIARLLGLNQGSSSGTAANPALTSDEQSQGYQYGTVPNSELFEAGGPQLGDVQQTQIGDCYFLSNLAALATKNPSAIENMVKDNGDGTYSVRFYNNVDGVMQPEWVTVNAELPQNAGDGLLSAQDPTDPTNGKSILWPAIIEKAYIVFNSEHHTSGDGEDNYSTASNGGIDGGEGSSAYEALTGQPAAEQLVGMMTDSQLYAALSQANQGQVVTASTGPNPGDGIAGEHVYTVLGTETANGVPSVVLRNPWGTDPHSSSGNGVFVIPLSEFRGDYLAVTTPGDALLSDAEQGVYGVVQDIRSIFRL